MQSMLVLRGTEDLSYTGNWARRVVTGEEDMVRTHSKPTDTRNPQPAIQPIFAISEPSDFADGFSAGMTMLLPIFPRANDESRERGGRTLVEEFRRHD